jgi:hypothetical protein
MGTIGTNISLLARWRPYRLPLSSAVFNGTERFGDVRELTVLFCAQFFPPFEHEDDDEHENETLAADFGVRLRRDFGETSASSVESLSRTLFGVFADLLRTALL